MIRIELPYHLRNLAQVTGEVSLAIEDQPITQRAVFDALETRYPQLRGTIRDHETGQRRPFIRFFAERKDLSNEPPDSLLPQRVASGEEVLMVVGALAGG